ncbi:MAG: hypothetical protein AAF742_00910 [Pseudomonadota bacterium]
MPNFKVFASYRLVDGSFRDGFIADDPFAIPPASSLIGDVEFLALLDETSQDEIAEFAPVLAADISTNTSRRTIPVADVNQEAVARDERARALTSIASYSLERAIGDIILYHQACSITDGLMEAEDTVNMVRSLGLYTSEDALELIIQQRQLLQNSTTGQ